MVDFSNLNQLRYIGSNIFQGNMEIRNLDKLKNLVSISGGAFSNVNISNGTSIIIEGLNNLTYIGSNAFNINNSKIKKLVFSKLPKLVCLPDSLCNRSDVGEIEYVELSELPSLKLKNISFEQRYNGFFPKKVGQLVINKLNSVSSIGCAYGVWIGILINKIDIKNMDNLEQLYSFYGTQATEIKFNNLPKIKRITGFDGHCAKDVDFNGLPSLEEIKGFSYSWEKSSQDIKRPKVHIDKLEHLKTLVGLVGGYDFKEGFSESNARSITKLGGMTLVKWKDDIIDLTKFTNLEEITENILYDLWGTSYIQGSVFGNYIIKDGDRAPRFGNNIPKKIKENSKVKEIKLGSVPNFDVKNYHSVFDDKTPITFTSEALKQATEKAKSRTTYQGYDHLYPQMNLLKWKDHEPLVAFSPNKFTDKLKEGVFDGATGEVILDFYNDAKEVGGEGLGQTKYTKLEMGFTGKLGNDIKFTPYHDYQLYPPYSSLYLEGNVFTRKISDLPNTPTVYEYLKSQDEYKNLIGKDENGKYYLVINAEGYAVLPFIARPIEANITGQSQMQAAYSPLSSGEQEYTIEKRGPISVPPEVKITQNRDNGDAEVIFIKSSDHQSSYKKGDKVKVVDSQGKVMDFTIKINAEGKSFIIVKNDQLQDQAASAQFYVKENDNEFSEPGIGTLPAKMVATDTPAVSDYHLINGANGAAQAVLLNSVTKRAYPWGTTISIGILNTDNSVSDKENLGRLTSDNTINIPSKYTAGIGDTPKQLVFFAQEEGKFISKPSSPIPQAQILKTATPSDVTITRENGIGHITIKSDKDQKYPESTLVIIYGTEGNEVYRGLMQANGSFTLPSDILNQLDDPNYSYGFLKEGITYRVQAPGKVLSDSAKITQKPSEVRVNGVQPDNRNGNLEITVLTPDGKKYPAGTIMMLPLEDKTVALTINAEGIAILDADQVPDNPVEIENATIKAPDKYADKVYPFKLLASIATKVSEVKIILNDKDGTGIITPLMIDKSHFPEGTTLQFKDFLPDRTFTIGSEGTAIIPAIDMPHQDQPAKAIITEKGKAPSQEIATTVPKGWDKTEVPSYIDVENFKGYSVLKLRKEHDKQYPQGTILELNGTKIEIDSNGDFLVQKKWLGNGALNEKVTLTAPKHFPSDPFSLVEYTPDPEVIEIYYDPDNKIAAFRPLKEDGNSYPEGSIIHVTGSESGEYVINNSGGTSYLYHVEKSEIDHYVEASSGKLEEPNKMTSKNGAGFEFEENKPVPYPIDDSILFTNVVPILEKTTKIDGKTIPTRVQILVNIKDFDPIAYKNAKVRLFTIQQKPIETMEVVNGTFTFESSDVTNEDIASIIQNGFYLQAQMENNKSALGLVVSPKVYFNFANIDYKEPIIPKVPSTGSTNPIDKTDTDKKTEKIIYVGGGGARITNIVNNFKKTKRDIPVAVGKNGNWYIDAKDTGLVAKSGHNKVSIKGNKWMLNNIETAVDIPKEYKNNALSKSDIEKTLQSMNDKFEKLPTILVSQQQFAYISGYPNGKVRPEINISRAEVAALFYRLFTDPRKDTLHSVLKYSDVNAQDWFSNAVGNLSDGQYLTGYPDDTFRGSNPITRAEFVAIAAKMVPMKEANYSFKDVPSDFWGKKYIDTAIAYGWINGYLDKTFRPNAYITRAEAISIVNHMILRGVNAEGLAEVNYRNFIDNPRDAWYYYGVIEAAIGHEYKGQYPHEEWIAVLNN